MKKIRLLFFISVGVFFFIIDRVLKHFALYRWAGNKLVNPYFGWNPFLNPGIAFGIPLPNKIIIFITLPIVAFLFYTILKNKKYLQHFAQNEHAKISAILIFLGAVSNLLDRIIYKNTVDYFLIFTGIINIADILIFIGFLFYFYFSSLKKEG